MSLDDASETSFTTVQKDDKLPHDASVFVGSLPSNIDQGDLTRMLMEHLSEHTQIKNIKVVRDNKGGVCAFVQCENAASATELIQTLRSRPPNLFMGRMLRYEPARAFRTLLVSYRAPTQIVRCNPSNSVIHPAAETTEVNLELPHAMRVWKHRNSRFHSMTYNSDAIQAEEANVADGSPRDNAIFLYPLNFDEETLRKLMSYFGSLEKFNVLGASGTIDQGQPIDNGGSVDNECTQDPGSLQYLYPHNAPRSPGMDPQCWEVKWEHRDDCVSALMTLKRVPHFSVSWAHQPPPTSHNSSPNFQIPASPSYSMHYQIPSPQFLSSGGKSRQRPAIYQRITIDGSVNRAYTSNLARQQKSDKSGKHEPFRDWAEDIDTSGSTDLTDSREEDSNDTWDLNECRVSWDSAELGGTTRANVNSSTNIDQQNTVVNDLDQSHEAGAQELCMPPTPGLDPSSITPLTPGTNFPVTPTSITADATVDENNEDKVFKDLSIPYSHSRPDREIDPTTLFVGGLEMFGPGAWDEEKVKNFFSRFKGLESVKLVRPVNSCAAFAFVKFDNAESPARAVSEEHNRVFEGRAMRVQLRDCNPPRNNWKYNRGRGRSHQNNFGSQRKYQYRPFETQDPTTYRFQNEQNDTNNREPKHGSEIQLSSLVAAIPPVKAPVDECAEMEPLGLNPSPHSASDLSTTVPPVIEKYREWYDEPESLTHTPEPSSLGSSVSTAGMQYSGATYAYPIPPGPFFPPQPWVQHYVPQGPYQPQQMPYYPGYPMYHPPPQQTTQGIVSPPNSDVGSSTIGVQAPWPHVGVYASYVPYPTVHPRPGMIEAGQGAAPVTTQAPLLPTGFIQNEQGTLIPVYQPEALDQYMASSGASPPISINHPNHPIVGSHRWGASSPYPYDANNPQSSNAALVTPNQVMNKHTQYPAVPSFPIFPSSPTPLRGGVDVSFNTQSPLYRRQGQGQRRENQQHNQSSSGRHHSHPRAYNGRSQRGHMHISAVSDLGHSGVPPPMMGGQWIQ